MFSAELNSILSSGKNAYIEQKEDNFIRVKHHYADLQNGFKHWKENIEKAIGQ